MTKIAEPRSSSPTALVLPASDRQNFVEGTQLQEMAMQTSSGRQQQVQTMCNMTLFMIVKRAQRFKLCKLCTSCVICASGASTLQCSCQVLSDSDTSGALAGSNILRLFLILLRCKRPANPMQTSFSELLPCACAKLAEVAVYTSIAAAVAAAGTPGCP